MIVVTIKGGMVQDIYSSFLDDAVIIDQDSDGCDPETDDLIRMRSGALAHRNYLLTEPIEELDVILDEATIAEF